ncbi:fimbrial protein [Morganella morganii]|uniref:fimbrial protein n=1 Tax=Morganella morganii TaxID=582 RepID=UPI0032DA6CA3
MMKKRYAIPLLMAFLPLPALAVVCSNAAGGTSEVFYDLTNSFTSANNQVGQIKTLNKEFSERVMAVCPRSVGSKSTTMRSYVANIPVVETEGRYKYLKLNDYLIGAMSITDSYAGTFYPPQEYVQMGMHPNVALGNPFEVMDRNFIFRLKVTRRFVDQVVIPKKTLFTVYVTTGNSDPLSIPVYTISYSGIINVPQQCKVGVNDIVVINFGKIGSQLFSQAGAGNKPATVNKKLENIAIQCTNVEAKAYLTLRIEAEKVNGNMIVSDNPDVGFMVGDKDGKALTPNNIGSVIPFQLDGAGSARTAITAWPVSVTGNKPKEGVFQSRGYLRVDYE